MASKFCIFCGNKPENKNLEHVIPQWLIKMTDRGDKDVFVNFPEDHKHIKFMNFKFPACTKCNSEYALLEAKVKPVMINVLEGKPISGEEASLLMDWFDKVRVGLWLTEMYLNPEIKKEIQPHFYIDSRVARTDRILSIQRLYMNGKGHGISFIGTNSDLFKYFPSAFTMLINDMYFINASTHNLVSPRVGFPTLNNPETIDPFSGKVAYSLDQGRHKVANPIITTFIPHPNSITFYQPILKEFVADPVVSHDDYVIEHSYNTANGLGGVFVQKGNVGNTRYLSQTDKTGTKTKIVKTTVPDVVMDTIKMQKIVHDKSLVKSYESDYIANKYGKMLEQYAKVK